MIILVYGGSGSGKSAFAEETVLKLNCSKKYYLATMQIYGEEGQQKVERHRRLRAGKGFTTVECPVDINQSVEAFFLDTENKKAKDSVALLECMSNLLANEMFCGEEQMEVEAVCQKIFSEVEALTHKFEHLVIVTNNIFEDGILYEESSRNYQKALGLLNQKLAELADQVYEVVVGIPIQVKG